MLNENQPLVYFLAKSNFGDNQPDFIKIGHTITDLSKRQTTLQTGNEAKIWEVGVIPFDSVNEASKEEKRIHTQFGAFRAEGEWFIATPRILKFIKNYAVQHTDLFTEENPSGTENLSGTENPSEISFGQQLAKARKSAGFERQKDLAEKVGYSRGHIALIEQDRGRPGKSLSRKFIELFGEFSNPSAEPKSENILAVKMEDGSWIAEDTAIDTFIEVIKVLGIEEVKAKNLYVNEIPLIADREYDNKAQRIVETYYIVSGTNTVTKKKILDDIANRLKCDITVFANPKV